MAVSATFGLQPFPRKSAHSSQDVHSGICIFRPRCYQGYFRISDLAPTLPQLLRTDLRGTTVAKAAV